MNRRRDRIGRPAFGQHCRHLLDVERIALGRFLDLTSRRLVERPFLAELVEQGVRLGIGEGGEGDAGGVGRGQPALTFFE